MDLTIEFTPEELDEMEPLLVKYQPREPRPGYVHRSVPYFLRRLAKLIDDLDSGYMLDLDDYTNNVSVRNVVEEFRQKTTGDLPRKFEVVLREFDHRFLELTAEIDRPMLGRRPGQWWLYRIPKDTSKTLDFFRGWPHQRT